MNPQPRYAHQKLLDFATALLDRAGLEHEKSIAVADVLVEGDLLGHTTHGLHLLAPYLQELQSGGMRGSGSMQVLADRPAALTWDGQRLPGPWLVLEALEVAMPRARDLGVCTVAIRRSHHIACLAAYLQRVTDQGLMAILSSSDPNNHTVAPYGGRAGVITPNPIAAAWPTAGDPVIIDVSMSITTNGMVGRLNSEGGRLPGKWLIDNAGQPTDDPGVVNSDPPGALLPLGGMEYGHKGYALGLLVETLTMALPGHGRADPTEGWTGEVFLQVMDPAAYSGREGFLRQSTWLADACRAIPPVPGVERVRLPGEGGLARRRTQLRDGLALHPGIIPALQPWSEKLGVAMPTPA